MDDLISTEKVLDLLAGVVAEIIKMPPEQKTGKWLEGWRYKWDGTQYWFRACSVCDFERDDCDTEKDTNYCPNCGARMDGVE